MDRRTHRTGGRVGRVTGMDGEGLDAGHGGIWAHGWTGAWGGRTESRRDAGARTRERRDAKVRDPALPNPRARAPVRLCARPPLPADTPPFAPSEYAAARRGRPPASASAL